MDKFKGKCTKRVQMRNAVWEKKDTSGLGKGRITKRKNIKEKHFNNYNIPKNLRLVHKKCIVNIWHSCWSKKNDVIVAESKFKLS